MTVGKRLSMMKEGTWLMLGPPRIQQIMTGVVRAGISREGVVALTYEDGTLEERPACEALLALKVEDVTLLGLVSYVQAGRQVLKGTRQ